MRLLARWIVGFVVASTFAISAMPTSSALEIEGDLFWRNVADVYGLVSVDADTRSYLIQSVPARSEPQDYTWTMHAAKLTLLSSKREENAPWHDVLSNRQHEQTWDNQTYEFLDATVRVTLAPTRDHGSTALYHAEAGGADVRIESPAGAGLRVRVADPSGAFMTVPDSARKGASGHAYAYEVPSGRLMEVSGHYEADLSGTVDAALFGWTITIETPQEEARAFRAGIRNRHDPSTGFTTGTILEYVTFHAEGANAVLPSMREGGLFYTPALRYSGAADYPGGTYYGIHEEHAPLGNKRMPLNGHIWLSVVEFEDFDANYVHAWGDADWKARPLAVVPPLPPAAGALPVVAAFVGLSFTTHLLPALGRAARAGLFLFYARLRDQEPHANPTRERIYEAIRAEPGLNLSRIVERLDIGWGTAAYHVQILKRQTRVRELRFLNRVCFFPSENPDETKQLQTVLLRQPNYREVMTVVEAEPGLSQREVAGKTGHARQYISRLVAKMEHAGLLRTEPSRMGRRYFPVPARTAEAAKNGSAPPPPVTPSPATPAPPSFPPAPKPF